MEKGYDYREEVAQGFAGALGAPGRSHDLEVELTDGQDPRGKLEAYAFGWLAGQEAWERLQRQKGSRRYGRVRRRRSNHADDGQRRAA